MKTYKMSNETKANLTILIAEIRGCKTLEEVNRLCDSWVTGNDLHPEQCKTFKNADELNSYLNSIRAHIK